MSIRKADKADWDAIWPIFHEVVKAGETYAYDPNTTKDDAESLWLDLPRVTYVFEEEGEILGTFYLKTNQAGNGSHVCNCGYMVSSRARGRGIAKLMCEYSQQLAITLGYKAMQFNFVVSTNEMAILIWKKLGFEIVGQLPKAFLHPSKSYVDALVMYKWLSLDT